jgi:hypothetical protein
MSTGEAEDRAGGISFPSLALDANEQECKYFPYGTIDFKGWRVDSGPA